MGFANTLKNEKSYRRTYQRISPEGTLIFLRPNFTKADDRAFRSAFGQFARLHSETGKPSEVYTPVKSVLDYVTEQVSKHGVGEPRQPVASSALTDDSPKRRCTWRAWLESLGTEEARVGLESDDRLAQIRKRHGGGWTLPDMLTGNARKRARAVQGRQETIAAWLFDGFYRFEEEGQDFAFPMYREAFRRLGFPIPVYALIAGSMPPKTRRMKKHERELRARRPPPSAPVEQFALRGVR